MAKTKVNQCCEGPFITCSVLAKVIAFNRYGGAGAHNFGAWLLAGLARTWRAYLGFFAVPAGGRVNWISRVHLFRLVIER